MEPYLPYLDCFTSFFFFPTHDLHLFFKAQATLAGDMDHLGVGLQCHFAFLHCLIGGVWSLKLPLKHRPPPTAILSMLLSGHVQHLYRFTNAKLNQSKDFTSPLAMPNNLLFPQAPLRSIRYHAPSLHLESTTSMAEAFWSVVPGVAKRSGKRSCSLGNLVDDYSMGYAILVLVLPVFKMHYTQMITKNIVSFGQKFTSGAQPRPTCSARPLRWDDWQARQH